MTLPIVSAEVTPARVSAGPAAASNSRFDKAAHQFEAMLLQELLKPLTSAQEETGGESSDDSLSGGSSSGPLQSFGTEAVAESLANTGALGFARQIEASLQQRVDVSQRRDTFSEKSLSGS